MPPSPTPQTKEHIALLSKLLPWCIGIILLLSSGIGTVMLIEKGTLFWHTLSPGHLLSISFGVTLGFTLAFLLIMWKIKGLIKRL